MGDERFIDELRRVKEISDANDLSWNQKISAMNMETEMCREFFSKLQREGYVRVGGREDYMRWLRGYIEGGGSFTHYYDYQLPLPIYVAVRDCLIPPLYGSNSITLIVPAGVQVAPAGQHDNFGGYGHNHIYFMDGFGVIGSFIPAYKDMVEEVQSGVRQIGLGNLDKRGLLSRVKGYLLSPANTDSDEDSRQNAIDEASLTLGEIAGVEIPLTDQSDGTDE